MDIREAMEREIQRVENLSIEELVTELEGVSRSTLSDTLAEISEIASSLNREYFLYREPMTKSVVTHRYETQGFSGVIPLVESHLVDYEKTITNKSICAS